MRRFLIVAAVLAVAGAAGFWLYTHRDAAPTELTLYGNVDLRQVDLAFNGTEMDFDNAKAALDMAAARVKLNQSALDLTLAGPRKEDIAQAEAQLRGNEAQLSYLRQQLADAALAAPVDGVVRSRLMEQGEM